MEQKDIFFLVGGILIGVFLVYAFFWFDFTTQKGLIASEFYHRGYQEGMDKAYETFNSLVEEENSVPCSGDTFMHEDGICRELKQEKW